MMPKKVHVDGNDPNKAPSKKVLIQSQSTINESRPKMNAGTPEKKDASPLLANKQMVGGRKLVTTIWHGNTQKTARALPKGLYLENIV
jgi:hypothetical protein